MRRWIYLWSLFCEDTLDERNADLKHLLFHPPLAHRLSIGARIRLVPTVEIAGDGDPMAQARIHTDGILAIQLEQNKLSIQHEAEELLRLPHCVILRIHILLFPLLGRGVVVVAVFALTQHLEDSRRQLGLLEQEQRVMELADAAEGLGDDGGLGEEGSGGGLEGDGPGGEEVDEVGGEGVAGYPHFVVFLSLVCLFFLCPYSVFVFNSTRPVSASERD